VKQPYRYRGPVTGPTLDSFSRGFFLGILVGEGHFGGDGRQPQVTVRMHTRHRALFYWLVTAVPGSKLYGPYHHGGRDYYHWTVRGRTLREHLWPLLVEHLGFFDDHVRQRITTMAIRYGLPLEEGRLTQQEEPPTQNGTAVR